MSPQDILDSAKAPPVFRRQNFLVSAKPSSFFAYHVNYLLRHTFSGAFIDSIVSIFSICTKEHVGWIDTLAVIPSGAVVAYAESFWNRAIIQDPTISCRPHLAIVYSYRSRIAVFIKRTIPNPTSFGLDHSFQKSRAAWSSCVSAGQRAVLSSDAPRIVRSIISKCEFTVCTKSGFPLRSLLRHIAGSFSCMFRALKGLGSLELPAYYTTA